VQSGNHIVWLASFWTIRKERNSRLFEQNKINIEIFLDRMKTILW
jgi:hypothetical protein